jgi:hypothetical protein
MPKRELQIVGNLKFKTKKDLHEYTEKLLLNKGVCEINNLDKDFLFFLSLYSRKPSHSDYDIKTIQKFKIALNPVKNDKPNHMSFIDNNNKEFTFSWRSCCDAHDTKPINKLKEACRTSIKEQTASCWYNNNKCNSCGKNKTDGFEVDHVNEFSKIYKNFMETNTIQIPDEFESDVLTSQYMFRQEDCIFEQAFQNYHKENAILKLLCKECHKVKTKCFISKQKINKY